MSAPGISSMLFPRSLRAKSLLFTVSNLNHENSPKTKQNKTKQNKTKQNKTKQNKTKQNKTKQNKTKQNKTKQNKTKQKQNKTKQNKTKQNKTKQNKTKQNKTNQNKTNQNKPKQTKPNQTTIKNTTRPENHTQVSISKSLLKRIGTLRFDGCFVVHFCNPHCSKWESVLVLLIFFVICVIFKYWMIETDVLLDL